MLLTNQLPFKGPQDPFLRLDKLLEWLTKLRNTFYLLDDRFVIKRYISETGRDVREGQQLCCLFWAFHSPSTFPSSPTPKLSEPCPFGFLQRLPHIDMTKSLPIGDQLNIQPLSPSQRSEPEAGRSNSLLKVSFSGNQSPSLGYLGTFQNSPHYYKLRCS